MKILKTVVLLLVSALAWSCASGGAQQDVLDGTRWELESYLDFTPIPKTTVSLVFSKGKIEGSSGCNTYFGKYQVEGESIRISQIGLTEKYCEEPEGVMEQEGFFVRSLLLSQRFELTSESLTLYGTGDMTLVFVPQP